MQTPTYVTPPFALKGDCLPPQGVWTPHPPTSDCYKTELYQEVRLVLTLKEYPQYSYFYLTFEHRNLFLQLCV